MCSCCDCRYFDWSEQNSEHKFRCAKKGIWVSKGESTCWFDFEFDE